MKLNIKDLLDPEKLEKHMPALTEYFEQGGTWQALVDVSNEDLSGHYEMGSSHYEAGRYEKAANIFTTLSLLNPYEGKYWFALGAARKEQKAYSEAAEAFLLCSATSEAADCFEAMGDSKRALELRRGS